MFNSLASADGSTGCLSVRTLQPLFYRKAGLIVSTVRQPPWLATHLFTRDFPPNSTATTTVNPWPNVSQSCRNTNIDL